MTPTARTLNLLRRQGHLAAVVEKWIPAVGRRQDLFGFADIIAVHRVLPGALLVQATSLSNVSSRLKKAKGRPELAVWLRSGGRFEVWGWHKDGDRWQVKRVEVKGGELEPVLLTPGRRRKAERKGERQTGLFDQNHRQNATENHE